MFKGVVKQKRELVFAVITLFLSILLFSVAFWSLRFLISRMNDALVEPKVNQNEITKFNLEKFNQLKLGE